MSTATTEIELLHKCLDGDTQAFEVIVGNYQELVCAITYSSITDVHVSEELAQQAFINAWSKLGQLKDLTKFRPWLCSIARNLVKSFIRSKKVDIIAKAKPMENINDTASSEAGPVESAVRKENEELVSKALKGIAEDYREPLVLYYRQRLSVKEIAESLDLSYGVAKKRLQRGREMVREQLDTIFEETLSSNGPKKAFTAAVMGAVAGVALKGSAAAAGVGAVGAAGAASGTSGATAATAGGLAALFSTVTGKIVTAAAVVITAAAVSVYSYNLSKQPTVNEPQEPVAKMTDNNTSVVEESQNVNANENVSGQDKADANQNNLVKGEPGTAGNKEAGSEAGGSRSSRHPDWPGLQEKVQSFYCSNEWEQTWVRLPHYFRTEREGNSVTNGEKDRIEIKKYILIDNGKERIEVKKDKKTVQYSETQIAGENPVVHNNATLKEMYSVQFAYLFGRNGNPAADSHFHENFIVEQIGQKDDGSLLIFKLKPPGKDNPEYEATGYVDAETLLPEKIFMTDNDPNSETYGQVKELYQFDFSPIADSKFEYTVKADEKVLPFKERPCFRGKVVDLEGKPVSGADVFVTYFPVSGDYLTGKSDSKGNFEIIIPPQTGPSNVFLPVRFWATVADNPDLAGWTLLETEDNLDFHEVGDLIPGHGGDIIQSDSEPSYQHSVVDGVKVKKEVTNPIQENPVIGNIVLVMEPTCVIAGLVSDNNGKPVAGAILKAGFSAKSKQTHLSFFTNQKGWEFEAVSDATGYYEIRGLPALWKGCDYTIHISAEGFVSESKRIEIKKPLDIKEFNVSLRRKSVNIYGVVKDNHGAALAGRHVSISVPNVNATDLSAKTDPNGIFALEGCPDIPGMTVSALLASNYPESGIVASKEIRDAFLFYPRVSKKIVHAAGKEEYFVELTAIRPETKVQVSVTDSAGNPLDEFKVKLDGLQKREDERFQGASISYPWRQMKLEKRTDKKGMVTFDNVPDLSEMTIIVSAGLSFTREMHALNGKQKEKKRLNEIDKAYSKKYQELKIPVELIEGQTGYTVKAVVPDKDEILEVKGE